MIVSNPPYIPADDINTLEHSVQIYDPKNALTDYGDGMTFYKRILTLSNQILNKNGLIVLEFGTNLQKKQIINIFSEFKHEIINDITNSPRVITLQQC